MNVLKLSWAVELFRMFPEYLLFLADFSYYHTIYYQIYQDLLTLAQESQIASS